MKSIASPCLSILVVFGLWRGVTGKKPSMTPSGETIIQEGDELKIRCQGEGNVHFSTSSNKQIASSSGQSEIYILKDEISGVYTLIRPRTKKEDTGWYACAEKGVEIVHNDRIVDHDQSQDIAWVYVYVNSSSPFVDSYSGLLLFSWGDLLIPCRSTSPNLRIKLVLTRSPREPDEDFDNTTYDPRVGFIVKNITQEYDSTMFTCILDDPEDMKKFDSWLRSQVSYKISMASRWSYRPRRRGRCRGGRRV